MPYRTDAEFYIELIQSSSIRVSYRWDKSTNKRLSFLLSSAVWERCAKPNNCIWQPSPGLTSTLASGHLALPKQCLQTSSLHHALPGWKRPSWGRPEVHRGLLDSSSHSVFNGGPIRLRINNWTLSCSYNQWPLSPFHRMHTAVMNLEDTYLISHFSFFLGYNQHLAHQNTDTHTCIHTHIFQKRTWSQFKHTGILFILFVCIPKNLLALKCWDRHSEVRMLWCLCLREGSFKVVKIVSLMKCEVWMKPHQKVSEVNLSKIVTSLLWNNAIYP